MQTTLRALDDGKLHDRTAGWVVSISITLMAFALRFYNLGFNIQATEGTGKFLKENGIRTHVLKKIGEGSEEIPEALRQGHIAYVINTRDISSQGPVSDGYEIRCLATENNVTIFTSLDTVRVLLDVLEETTLTISTIDA